MAAIIKNQILKYLSKYFKNLSPDKINFNTIKGEGVLQNLELDEIALTDLLALPSWMRIKKASCNKVTFTIPWRRIKSEPMVWNLDEVLVEVETCEQLRDISLQEPEQQTGKYNTINRIVDGMSINVNSVSIQFSSSTFTASLQIIRIKVESKSSAWQKCDLRYTKIKDPKRGQLLLFKELNWQSVKIEARSILETDLPPLRLLTNEAVCRITIKKRLLDCFIIGCKLVIILEDLLWVLTDSQLKAVLHFVDSLSGLIKRANQIVRKKKAARKLEVLPEYQAQKTQHEMVHNKSVMSHIFSRHDVIETSYHFLAQKIDLHISDDPGPGRSAYPELQDGGAIQIKLFNFQVDYYPYHLAIKDRSHWGLYSESRYPHPQWLSQSQNEFRSLLLNLVEDNYATYHLSSSSYTEKDLNSSTDTGTNRSQNTNVVKKYLTNEFNKIMTACILLRVSDFTINRVTTVKRPNLPKEFIKTDKERYSLPENEIIHAEFTYYYFPGDVQFPLPAPKFYVQIYPIEIQFDVVTIIWLNTFFLNLHKSVMMTATVQSNQSSQLFYMDVKFEAIMPRVIFETILDKGESKDRPRSLQFQISRLSITNTRSTESHSSTMNLGEVVAACQKRSLFFTENFPSSSQDLSAMTEKFVKHVQGKDNVRNPALHLPANDIVEAINMLSQDLLWIEAKDVWCVHLESIWGDFYGVRAVGSNRPVPFLDAFPLTLWIHMDLDALNKTEIFDESNTADIYVMTYVANLISVQINKYQALFMTKISKEFSEVATFLTVDTDRLTGKGSNSSLVITSMIPQIEITMVTSSSQTNGKESSVGDPDDVESSIIPDTSSIETRSIQWNNHNTMSTFEDLMPSETDFAKDDTIATIESNLENICYKSACKTSPDITQSGSRPTKFTNLKKGITQIMSMDFSMPKSPQVEDVSDTISIRSDDSSDTENCNLNLYQDDANAMFRIAKQNRKGRSVTIHENDINVEVADDALCEEIYSDLPTPTTVASEKDSFNSFRRKDLVAATTIKLGQIDIIAQSIGLHSLMKLQVGNVSLEECFSIPWDELQAQLKNKFNTRARDWHEVKFDQNCNNPEPWIKARFENEVCPPCPIPNTNTNVTHWRNARATATVDDLQLNLGKPTIKSFSEFIEPSTKDEYDDKPVELEAFINNVRIVIREELAEMKSDYSKPAAILLKRLKVFRSESGAIVIEPMPSESADDKDIHKKQDGTDSSSSSSECQMLKEEITLLRKRLQAMQYLSEENCSLRQYQEETRILRSCLNAAQEEISVLLDEKRSLLNYTKSIKNSSGFSENLSFKRS